MKTQIFKKNKVLLACLATTFAIGTTKAQLHEKKYDLSPEGVYQFSTVENIPQADVGQILISVNTDGWKGVQGTIISRVDMQGAIQWQTSYDPIWRRMHERTSINNHRVGFNPNNGNVMVVGQVNAYLNPLLFDCPGFIELNTTTGAIVGENYYKDADYTDGTFNAIHSVMSGANQGAYMAGFSIHGNGGVSPFLAKTAGSSPDFRRLYSNVNPEDNSYYIDVDVDNKENLVVCVGRNAVSNAGIVDVYSTNGTLMYKHQYDDIDGRFTSVKSVAPGRVVIGGSKNGRAYVLQIDLTSGDINWSRYVGSVDDYFLQEVIEVEQDAEGRPIIMVREKPNGSQEIMGYVARLHTNGVMDWIIEERLRNGIADIEPQLSDDDHIAMLTGMVDGHPFSSRLTYLDHTSGFYGCQEEVEIKTYSDLENNMSTPSHTVTSSVTYTPVTMGEHTSNIIEDNTDCCWLPTFNVIPWNHPWQTVYYINQAVINIDDPINRAGYIYTWERRHVRDIWTGEYNTTPPLSVAPAPSNHTITLDLIDWNSRGMGARLPERNLVYVTGTSPDGCKGWDADYVTIVEDGKRVIRPDYSNTSFGNDLEYENYHYCQDGSGMTNRYLYEHEGAYLSSAGFDYLGTPQAQPMLMNSPTNLLASTGTYTFQEKVTDSYKAPSRFVEVNTDVKVDGCPGCPIVSPITIESWVAENGRKMFSISTADLTPTPHIVKYSFALFLSGHPTLSDEHHLIKRYEMRKSTSITDDDFLIPVIDERYLDNYPAWANVGTHRLYLDVWYTTGITTTNPISCHKRYELVSTSGNLVYRLASRNADERLDEDIEKEFNIYPNPTNGEFTIEGTENAISVEVVDIQGRLVKENLLNVSGQNKLNLNLNEVPSGMYLVKIKTNDGRLLINKLMKE